MEINKQDKVRHETEVCEYRKVKCHDCGQIQETVGRLEGSLMELDGKVEAAVKEINRMRKNMETVKEMNKEMNRDRYRKMWEY
jgi:predicted RNase H-like nuclease (RuvC/YqgF family)